MASLPTPADMRRAHEQREQTRLAEREELRRKMRVSAQDPLRVTDEDVFKALYEAFRQSLAKGENSRDVTVHDDEVWELVEKFAFERLGQKPSYHFHLRSLEPFVEQLRIPQWRVYYDEELDLTVFIPNECCAVQ